MILRGAFTCLLIILVSHIIQAQQFNFRTFTTREGLANNNVREIAVDSSGFLWAATWDGLSRYDGYEFKNYYHVPGDSTSLPYFAIQDLAVDGANNLWVLSDLGKIVLYDRINDNFKPLKGIPVPIESVNGCIDVDKNGDLWYI